ncbi:MAG: hypothetical protein COT74_05935 [Bdellovibrionales bacterium CG10_big_fil_rev_8_21_14_0_10_45_34]|nr:MAG: hypothetical protein COT74_05935 [Bdellovibrionales bacterium CG10_big_fil_rev_8_21_14_0_10_45_34]
MKKCLALLTIVVPFFAAAMAQAGAVTGGGGKGVICRDSNGAITFAELLDLFEAKQVYGLEVREYTGTLEEAIKNIKSDIEGTMTQPEIHLFPLFRRVQSILKLATREVVLKPVDDAAEVVLPVNCHLEQVANYVDDNLLIVSSEIWEAFDVTNKAALIAHEAIYRMERFGGSTNSRRARKIVGHLFAGYPFKNVKEGLPVGAKRCSAHRGDRTTFQFAYFPAGAGNLTAVQFFLFDGGVVFSKKTAIMPIKLPWLPNMSGTCGQPEDGCNFTGGDTSSNFEGEGFVSFGSEMRVSNGVPQMKLYLSINSEKHYLDCLPE